VCISTNDALALLEPSRLRFRRDQGMNDVAISFGVASMTAPLRRVAMRRPRAMLIADPTDWHYAHRLDPTVLLEQYEAFVRLVSKSGAEIVWLDDHDDGLADSIFTYDPSFVIPSGAIILRMGKAPRLDECGLHERLYAGLDIPIIDRIIAPGTVEGGDCFWLDDKTLAVGRSFRTNQSGIEQLSRILARWSIDVREFDLPVFEDDQACLHLMSIVSPLADDLALVYRRLLPVALYELMLERGMTLLEAPDDDFIASRGLCLNVLATAPRQCIMVDGFSQTAGLMRDAGCIVDVFPGDGLCIPCEGGPTCMTRPILRAYDTAMRRLS
jgi:N-dimethylarginine dimethylaminohydrolase